MRRRDRVDDCDVAGREREVRAIAHALGVRRLADDDHRDVGAVGTAPIRAVGHSRLGRYGRRDRGEQRRAGRHVAGLALPSDGPAAALHAEVVGRLARDVDPRRALRERQRVVFVLEQDERFADRAARDLAMLRRAELAPERGIGHLRAARVHQPHRHLHAQDPRDRVVDPREPHATFLDQRPQRRDEPRVARRHHHHVHAGIDRGASTAVL